MKIFSIVGLALAANSMLANGYTLRGHQSTSLNQFSSQQVINPVSRPDFLAPPEAPVPEPPAGVALVGGPEGSLAAPAVPVQGEPYAFSYDHSADQFSSGRSEVSDGKKVTGHYTLQGADGIQRIVHYVADGDGFRASIQTNEPGTESQSPSGVLIQSSQLPGAEIARQFGPAEPAAQPFVQPAPAQPVFQPVVQPFVQPAPAQPAFQPVVQPVIQPAFVSTGTVFAPQQFGAASPSFATFQGQEQTSQEEDDEQTPEQQHQLQEEEPAPAPAPAPIKIRPQPAPTPAPVPPPAPSTAAPPVKGRPSGTKSIPQPPTKSIPPPTKSGQLPAKISPAPAPIKVKPISAPVSAPAPAPVKGKPIAQPPPPPSAPAGTKNKPAPPPTKGRPSAKLPPAPTKPAPSKRPQQHQVVAPRPLPALLPVPAPAKIVPAPRPVQPQPQPEQHQQEEDDDEPTQHQEQPQPHQQFEVALEEPQDESAQDQDF